MFDPKSIADSIVSGKDPEASETGEGDTSSEELAAEDVLAAFAENDPKALASALKEFFKVVDAEPHVEGGTEASEK